MLVPAVPLRISTIRQLTSSPTPTSPPTCTKKAAPRGMNCTAGVSITPTNSGMIWHSASSGTNHTPPFLTTAPNPFISGLPTAKSTSSTMLSIATSKRGAVTSSPTFGRAKTGVCATSHTPTSTARSASSPTCSRPWESAKVTSSRSICPACPSCRSPCWPVPKSAQPTP